MEITYIEIAQIIIMGLSMAVKMKQLQPGHWNVSMGKYQTYKCNGESKLEAIIHRLL